MKNKPRKPRLTITMEPDIYESYISYLEKNGYDKSKFTELLLKKFLSTLDK